MRSIFVMSHQRRKIFNIKFFPNYGSLISCNSGSTQQIQSMCIAWHFILYWWLIINLQVTLTFTCGMQFTTGQPLHSHYARLSQSHNVMNILQNAITLLYSLEYSKVSNFLQCKLSSCSKWVRDCYNLMKRSAFSYVCVHVCVCMYLCVSM